MKRARRVAVGCIAYETLWFAARGVAVGVRLADWVAVALLLAAFLLTMSGRTLLLGYARGAAASILVSAAPFIAWSQIPAGHASLLDTWSLAGPCVVAVLLVWRHRTVPAIVVLATMCCSQLLWGGLTALVDYGASTLCVLVAVIAASIRALGWYQGQVERGVRAQRKVVDWHAAQDAYQSAHRDRIRVTADMAGDLLEQIELSGGRLDPAGRAECRVLHQTIRDETRAGLLLNDATRSAILAHRRRGASVDVRDDGDLGSIPEPARERLLDELAGHLHGLTSHQIAIRSLKAESDSAISVVATSVDPVAAALGLDDGEDHVDLWLELPRPTAALQPQAG